MTWCKHGENGCGGRNNCLCREELNIPAEEVKAGITAAEVQVPGNANREGGRCD